MATMKLNVRIVPADAIVIERSELPEVRVGGNWREAGSVYVHDSSDAMDHRAVGLGHLALAEYLTAHPPVDEEQVEAITSVLHDVLHGPHPHDDTLTNIDAERLYRAGVRVVTS